MNRKLFAFGIILAVAFVLYAQDAKTVKIEGYIMDNACASGHVKDANFGERVNGLNQEASAHEQGQRQRDLHRGDSAQQTPLGAAHARGAAAGFQLVRGITSERSPRRK